MNREIKFRAWDKINKVMFNPFDFFCECKYGEEYIETENKNKFELMQFTGLNDKNGKEIFEGDIVRYTKSKDFVSEIFIIELTNGFFGGKWMTYFKDGKRNWHDCISPALKHKEMNKYEVIGNIYENPELLEEK